MTGFLVSGVLLGFAVVLRRQQVLRRRLARLEHARRSTAPRPPVDRRRLARLHPVRLRAPGDPTPLPSVQGLADLARPLRRAGG